MIELNALNRMFGGSIHGKSVLETIKDLIRGVLKPGIRLMQLTSCLGSKLAELIAIRDVGESSKDKI
jgi:hypothetical protein